MVRWGKLQCSMKSTVFINQSQLKLLQFITKYRFVTARQVQQNFGFKSRTSVNNKLKRLVATGLIGMQYDKSKKLSGVPAIYYATPQGLREVTSHLPYITEAIIRAAYSDADASGTLIEKSAEIFNIAQPLRNQYPDMTVLTARQIGDLSYFPRPLPDLYLAHKRSDTTHRYFVYNLRDTKRYDIAVRSTITKLMSYRESETYAESGNEFPAILLVCHSAAIERLAQRVMQSALNKSYESIPVYTTSYQALVQLEDTNQPIWSSLNDPDTLITLTETE